MREIDPEALARDVAALVRVPSLTGDERAALECLAGIAERLGLRADLHRHDLEALRADPRHPGEEAPREELWGLHIVAPPAAPTPRSEPLRVCLNGHVDVVAAGERPWSRGNAFSGALEDGFVHGRGSADMKGGVVAALHALAAAADDLLVEVVLQAVASEEDGGLGTFAALERDDRFDAALIPEPTAFDVVCTQAGALTFTGIVPGVAAHAAVRTEGISAIDRYVEVHRALQEHERRLNSDVADPLLRDHPLPYPLSVGRVEAGRWSSTVPDRLEFEGRLGVRVEETVGEARAAFEAVVREACADAEVAWTGGQFAPGSTPPDHPFCTLVRDCAAGVLGSAPPLTGVSYGSDLRHFSQRGIPVVMFGPGGLERAHAVDERVSVDDVVAVARTIARVLVRFGADYPPQTR
ncbi:MAG TPA: M20/M25/M40 family metallo-hydrolase [Solirubrobacteraceae bacterium]